MYDAVTAMKITRIVSLKMLPYLLFAKQVAESIFKGSRFSFKNCNEVVLYNIELDIDKF